MRNPRYIAATSLLLALAGCASEPVAYSEPRYGATPVSYDKVAYSDTGHVVAIDVERRGGTSGGGAVAGAIVGGVLGHQVGSGRGNTAATVAGAVGGALAGNEIERRRNNDEHYRITVRLRDGREASFYQDDLNGLRVGDRVRVADNRLYRS